MYVKYFVELEKSNAKSVGMNARYRNIIRGDGSIAADCD